MKTLKLDEKMQTKVSVNGLDDSVDYSSVQCDVALKVVFLRVIQGRSEFV